MTTIDEFLLARVTEDEIIAKAAAQKNGAEQWRWFDQQTDEEITPDPFTEEFLGEDRDGYQYSLRSLKDFPAESGLDYTLPKFILNYSEEVPSTTALYLTTFDAARVLEECKAKRDVVDNYVYWRDEVDLHADFKNGVLLGYRESILCLCRIYADHPDFGKWDT